MVANLNNNFYFSYYFGFLGYFFSAGFFAYQKFIQSIQMRGNKMMLMA